MKDFKESKTKLFKLQINDDGGWSSRYNTMIHITAINIDEAGTKAEESTNGDYLKYPQMYEIIEVKFI